MPHDVALVSTAAISLAYALLGGLIAGRIGLSPVVGYLLAGVVVGPFTPGFVADARLAGQLADIGVMLLMFGIGMHFSPRDLLAVWRIAVPGAITQIALATALGVLSASSWGWSLPSGLVLGVAISVASTVVLLRQLQRQGTLESPDGRIAVGWLVVEDLVTVLVLVLLPTLAVPLGGSVVASSTTSDGNLIATVAITLGKLAGFIALMLLIGGRLLPWLLEQANRSHSRELFTLAVMTVAVGIAFGAAELFGVSYALGAFFSGLVMSGSRQRHHAEVDLGPLQDVFGVLFFVSVGMLFDPALLVHQTSQVLALAAIILLGKPLCAALAVAVLGYSRETATVMAASVAQIGEFSFMLGELGVSMHLLPREGQGLIVAGAMLSITINPFVFRASGSLQQRSRPSKRADVGAIKLESKAHADE